MIIGQSIANDTTVYSPWFERQGDAATFFLEVIARHSNSKVSASVQTKNAEEADSAAGTATGGGFSAITSTGTFDTRATSLKELVRLKLFVEDTNDASSWSHVRIMSPSWETN